MMMTRSISIPRRLLLLAALVLALAAGILGWRFVSDWWYGGPVIYEHGPWVIDASDDRELAGFADDIFFGRVTESVGQTMVGGTPQTHYRVAVLEALKGSLSGTIAVSEQGGVWPGGAPFRMEGDPDLLEPGKSYLLATHGSSGENGGGPLVISAGGGYGKIELPAASGESGGGGILATATAGELRSRFTDAIANQIPFDPSGGG